MDGRTRLSDGFSDPNLIPLAAIDLSAVNTLDEIINAMSKTAFGGRKLAEAREKRQEWEEARIHYARIEEGVLSEPPTRSPYNLIIEGTFGPQNTEVVGGAEEVITVNPFGLRTKHPREHYVNCPTAFGRDILHLPSDTPTGQVVDRHTELKAASELLSRMKDEGCYTVLTLSGAMTVAQQGLLICDMIEEGYVDAIVSTGALMAHGFVQSAGMTHFKEKTPRPDNELFKLGYNRVYDTLELEQNLDDAEEIVKEMLEYFQEHHQKNSDRDLSSKTFNELLGIYLERNTEGRGILKSARQQGVPVYVPAFTDSELGLDLGIYNRAKELERTYSRSRDQKGSWSIRLNPLLDLEDYTQRIFNAHRQGKKLAIFTIGGGVPRNWAQQVGPYLDIIQKRVGTGGATVKFHYGIRICPEPDYWGGLSGCTYEEGVSWGKFVPVKRGGRFVEVAYDATIAWPFILKSALDKGQAQT